MDLLTGLPFFVRTLVVSGLDLLLCSASNFSTCVLYHLHQKLCVSVFLHHILGIQELVLVNLHIFSIVNTDVGVLRVKILCSAEEGSRHVKFWGIF